MISFPWRTIANVNADASCVALLGVVRLSSIKLLPVFVRFGARIDAQMRKTPGLIAYRTGADFPKLVFYHLSAWSDATAIQEFVETRPHLDAMEQLTGTLGETVFRYWTVSGSKLPLRFADELHRIESTP